MSDVHRGHFTRCDQLRSKTGRLGNRSSGQISAADALGKSEVVLDARTRPGLAAWRLSFEEYGRQALGGAIHSCSESGRSAADDREVVERRLGRRVDPRSGGQLGF